MGVAPFAMLLLFAAGQKSAHAQQCAESLPVGFRIMDKAGRKMAVWYPSSVPDSAYEYPGRATIFGSVALNAPPAQCGRFPLVMFSHGINGCGTQTVYLTEQIARRGYVVVAPDHADAGCSVDGSRPGTTSISEEPFRDPDRWTDQTYADRRNDIQAIIGAMLTDTVMGPAIQADAIAGVGHSLGGYTMMGMAGGWASWKDDRLRAVALLSPYSDPFLVAGRNPQITIPVMFQGGTTDFGLTPSIERPNGAYDRSGTPKFYGKYVGGHLLWTNLSCLRQTIGQCVSSPSPAQSVTQDVLAFLDRFVKNKQTPALFEPRLTASRVTYRRTAAASAASAASFASTPLAPDSWASIFSEGLSSGIHVAQALPLPELLGGLTVRIRDSRNQMHRGRIHFISPTQINFVVPADAAVGSATADVLENNETIASGAIQIAATSAGFFSANRSGAGAPAGEFISVAPDGSRSTGLLATQDGSPVALNVQNGQVYLVLYGTGIRNAGANRVTATIGTQTVPTAGVAASLEYPGLDQVALGPLPAVLAGTGAADLRISVDGQPANVLRVFVQ